MSICKEDKIHVKCHHQQKKQIMKYKVVECVKKSINTSKCKCNKMKERTLSDGDYRHTVLRMNNVKYIVKCFE
jgi:hypothetical protein